MVQFKTLNPLNDKDPVKETNIRRVAAPTRITIKRDFYKIKDTSLLVYG